jgi:hypothetical protein
MPRIATDRPLQDAVDIFSRKVPVGSGMSSREWELLQSEIRMRAMFSARVENERLLAEMQVRLQARIALAKKDGRTIDRGVFIEEMREELRKAGYKRGEAKRGAIQDLKSTRRLGLIWDMNLAQAQGYARWKADMTPEGLENEPCYEFIRVMSRIEVRDWPVIWEQSGGEFFDGPGSNDDYSWAKGRMIAAKNDPIWKRISRFGTPWPPFDWGSGMGLRGVGRDEAERLGVIDPEDVVTPLAFPFNSGTRASAKKIPESGRESLRSAFGDAIRFDGEEIILQRETSSETDEQRLQDITASLRERARNHYLQTRDQFARELRREGDGAEVAGGGERAADSHAVALAQAASVAVGRKQLYHDTMPPGDTEAFFRAISKSMPSEVAIDVAEGTGDILIWRRDLLDIDPKQVVAEMHDGRGGILMGYGLDSPAWVRPGPHVAVRIFRLPREPGDEAVMGFDAPVESWRTFADARARDIADAWGTGIELEWKVRP